MKTTSTIRRNVRRGTAALVVIGDAAHAMGPNLGRGANEALADAVALAEMAMAGGMANPMGAAMRSMFAQAEAAGHGGDFVPQLADLFAAANGLDLADAVKRGA